MRKTNKSLLAIGLLGGMSFSLCACASWDEQEIDIENAHKLQATAIIDNGLKLNLTSEVPLFSKDILKGDVLVVDKETIKVSEGNQRFTMEDILKARLEEKQYSLSFNNESSLTITLKSYEITRYDIYVTRESTKDHNLAMASISLVEDQEILTPYFKFETSSFLKGEVDPEFCVAFYNAEINDSTKVAFDGAFADLEPENVTLDGGVASIKTKGIIADNPIGVLTLQDGFFKGLSGEMDFYANIDTSIATINQRTFALTGSTFSFDMKALGVEFESRIGKSNISLEADLNTTVSLGGVNFKDATTITIQLVMLDDTLSDVNAVLDFLQNKSFTISNGFKDFPGDFDFVFLPNFPSLSLRTTLSANTFDFELEGEIHNATEASYEFDDLQFDDSNIILSGNNANMTLATFAQNKNGFRARFVPGDDFGDRAYGKLSIPSKVTTLWGAPYALSKLFDTEDIKVGKTYVDDLPGFEEKLLKTPLKSDSLKDGTALGAYANALGYQTGEDLYGKSLGALIENLEFFHVTGEPNTPYGILLDDVLDQLDEQFSEVERDVDQLEDFLDLYDDAASRLGVDSNHFDALRSRYDDFRNDCLDTFADAYFQYRNSFRDALLAIVNSTDETQTIQVYFATDADGNTVLTVPSPDDSDVSIDGETITDMYTLHVPTSYFQPCAAFYATHHRFDSAFKQSFKACLNAYLTENPRQNINTDRLYATILGRIQMRYFKANYISPLIDALENYITALDETSGESALTAYLEMITCRVNFQSEAEKQFHTARAKLKNGLSLAMCFVSVLDKFAASEFLTDALIAKYKAAETSIATNEHLITFPLDTEYSYALNSPIQGHIMKADFSVKYNGAGNNASFTDEFHFYEGEDAGSCFNNGCVVSSDEIALIYQRFLLLAGDTPQNDFSSYLVANGVLSQEQIDLLRQKQGDDLPLLTSFNGFSACEPFKGHVMSSVSGYEMIDGCAYTYGKDGSDPDRWQGKEARGTLLSLNDLTKLGSLLDAYARYDDGHPFAPVDEHHALELNMDGYYFAVILRA